MVTYGQLNLQKLRDDCGLDFAHFTYLRGQCSCCYSPKDMPDRYWAKGKKPKMINIEYNADGTLRRFDWDRSDDDIQYILFKNANNCGGIVTKVDTICKMLTKISRYQSSTSTVRVYIEWQFPIEKMDQVLQSLQDQLDEDYLILRPKNELECICIMLKDDPLSEEDQKQIFTR